MRHYSWKTSAAIVAVLAGLCFPLIARAELKAGWNGKRHISYQQQKDLFYNYYAQPGPYNGPRCTSRRCRFRRTWDIRG
jgi:hypothetical protein